MRNMVWVRRDLRLSDHQALIEASDQDVLLVFIYQPEHHGRAQRWWLHHSLLKLQERLDNKLLIMQGKPDEVIPKLTEQYGIEHVFWQRDLTPDGIAQATSVKSLLDDCGVKVSSYAGQVLNDPWSVKNQQGEFFKVFTPFWKASLPNLVGMPEPLPEPQLSLIDPQEGLTIDDLKLLPKDPDWAEQFHQYHSPGELSAMDVCAKFCQGALSGYKDERNRPDILGTSRLSPHIHFGEISVRQIWHAANEQRGRVSDRDIDHFLSELGWRDFSYYLIYHVPHMIKKNFRPAFDDFPWIHNPADLKKWQQGKTGYPIVDAGMRELYETGYMHNRLRMIVGSFLTKHLQIDWRDGAAWFADTLHDADIANNTAGWQWVSGSGADAAPYFRIFNPVMQGQKFDPNGDYVRRWVPELEDIPTHLIHDPELLSKVRPQSYPPAIVDHKAARDRALAQYDLIKKDR